MLLRVVNFIQVVFIVVLLILTVIFFGMWLFNLGPVYIWHFSWVITGLVAAGLTRDLSKRIN